MMIVTLVYIRVIEWGISLDDLTLLERHDLGRQR